MTLRAFRAALPLGMLAAAAMVASAVPAYAVPDQPDLTPAASVASITDGLARQLATSLADRSRTDRLVPAVSAGPVDLAGIEPGSALARAVGDANRAVLAAKGLPADSGSVLRVRLADPGMRAALARGETPLIAATPTDDAVTSVAAYDRTGAKVLLDTARTPARPVLLVEVDVAKALPLGLKVMRDTLNAAGIGSATPTSTALTTSGYWATKVNAIRLSDDKEPWIKGAAEIFNVVGGFGLDGNVKIDTVTMPYLDYDGTTYYPNQLLVHFSAYKYNLADVVMMEDDGDTNYLALAQAIADALLYIVDGGAYTPLVNAILAAMPTSWWTDDPDYVDSWYTLSTTSSGRLYGAAANGWMDVVPYWVSAL